MRECVAQRSSCHELANEVATRNTTSRTHCQLRPVDTGRHILKRSHADARGQCYCCVEENTTKIGLI